MSASAWSVCPRCRDKAQRELQQEISRVAAMYGVVPAEEYEAARAALPDGIAIEETFREDYEFYGADTGEVVASYGGACQVCNLSINFKETRRSYTPGEETT